MSTTSSALAMAGMLSIYAALPPVVVALSMNHGKFDKPSDVQMSGEIDQASQSTMDQSFHQSKSSTDQSFHQSSMDHSFHQSSMDQSLHQASTDQSFHQASTDRSSHRSSHRSSPQDFLAQFPSFPERSLTMQDEQGQKKVQKQFMNFKSNFESLVQKSEEKYQKKLQDGGKSFTVAGGLGDDTGNTHHNHLVTDRNGFHWRVIEEDELVTEPATEAYMRKVEKNGKLGVDYHVVVDKGDGMTKRWYVIQPKMKQNYERLDEHKREMRTNLGNATVKKPTVKKPTVSQPTVTKPAVKKPTVSPKLETKKVDPIQKLDPIPSWRRGELREREEAQLNFKRKMEELYDLKRQI